MLACTSGIYCKFFHTGDQHTTQPPTTTLGTWTVRIGSYLFVCCLPGRPRGMPRRTGSTVEFHYTRPLATSSISSVLSVRNVRGKVYQTFPGLILKSLKSERSSPVISIKWPSKRFFITPPTSNIVGVEALDHRLNLYIKVCVGYRAQLFWISR